MIVPMNKVQLLFFSKFLEEDIAKLQELGIVDLSFGEIDSDLDVLKNHANVSTAITVLENVSGKEDSFLGNLARKSVREVVGEITEVNTLVNDLTKEISELESMEEFAKCFGNSSNHDVKELEKEGVLLSIYNTRRDETLKRIQAHNKETATEGSNYSFVCFHKDKKKSLWAVFSLKKASFKAPDDWVPIQFLDMTYSEIVERKESLIKRRELYRAEIKNNLQYKHTLLTENVKLSNEIAKQAAICGAKNKDGLFLFDGYVPEDSIAELYKSVEEYGWGLVCQRPSEDDEDVPTKIKNFAPIRIIKPLFSFLDVDPGYREVDISFLFLAFMSLFVGMIIGDAGYGSILLLVTFITIIISQVKGNQISLVQYLFLWFSFTTIAWGAITGNWFGYEPISKVYPFSFFVFPQFFAFSPESAVNVQLFAFRVGIIQLTIAHFLGCIRLFKSDGFLASLNQIGNASMLIGLFFLVLRLLLGENFPMPDYALTLIVAGFITIVLTSEQKKGKNIFIGALKGVANVITIGLDSVGAFADIISYIRLYAVGLASFSIAISFNGMGQGIMESGGISIVSGILVIALGHTLNLVMALLAVVVHGVRLNVLEFSRHIGMEWSGRKYNPLKKKIILRRI